MQCQAECWPCFHNNVREFRVSLDTSECAIFGVPFDGKSYWFDER